MAPRGDRSPRPLSPGGGALLILTSIAVGAAIVADAWLLAFIGIRGRRTWIKASFTVLALSFIVMGTAYVGTSEGVLAPMWGSAVLAALVLAHPFTAILVLSLIHGETLPRRRPAAFLLLAPVPLLAFLAPGGGWNLQNAYDLNVLGAFLVLCLAVALAEVVYVRITSVLLDTESFWLSLGVIAFIVAGPVYSFELNALEVPPAVGLNVATPLILTSFALVAFHADPFPTPFRGHRRRWIGTTSVGDGLLFVFDEARPKYALVTARGEARRGRPVLILARSSAAPLHPEDKPLASTMEASQRAALRTIATVSEFLVRDPGGLVVVRDLADVAAMSGWSRTRESVARLARISRETNSTVILSTSRLSPQEKEDLRALQFPWWTLPDPADELEAVLADSFGSGAGRLLAAFCRAHALRREDVTTDHVDALASFLGEAVGELARTAADAKAAEGLREQVAAVAARLRTYRGRSAVDLAGGDWPSRKGKTADQEMLVTAAEYWKGKETEELLAAADELGSREPLFEQARKIFAEHLGDAGEGVLRSELARLGRKPEELTVADVVRLADRAAVDLAAMADVVDVPQEKDRIQGQVESIRKRLLAIAGDDA